MLKTFYSITIWILAALINALLSALLLTFSDGPIESWPGVFALALVFSLLFSAPGIFIFWIVFLSNNNDDESIFRLLLRTGIICAALTGFFFVLVLGSEFKGKAYFIALFGIISAITSIMLHHRSITSLSYKQVHNENNKI